MDKYYFSTETSKLVNPPPLSKYLDKERDAVEDLYPSRKKAPLGCTRIPNIPDRNLKMVFGLPTKKDISAGDLMYPSGKRIDQSVYSEIFRFKKATGLTSAAGIKLEDTDNTGGQMKEIFNYDKDKNSTIIVKSSYANNSRRKPCGENIVFDCPEHREFIFDERKNEAKLKKSRKARVDRNCVEVLWNLLKIKNHVNFLDLISSFKAYQNGSDKITLSDLQRMCQNFGISAPLHVIEKLLEECDIDKDGAISYEEFMHCLNWKDLIPENYNFKTSKYANDWREMNNPSDDVIDHFRTTSSFIGDHKYSVNSRNAGLPSYNKKVDRSKLKGLSEFNEFGDASSVIQPNSFSKHGVFEEDLKILYTKEQIMQILMSSGIRFTVAAFEMVWNNVNCDGKASIGTVWNALKNVCLSHCKHL